MIGLVVIGAVVVVAVLALIGKAQAQSAQNTSTSTAPIPVQDISGTVPDAFGDAEPQGGNMNTDANSLDNWQSGADITTDETTWPSGNAVWSICRAIAHAEGYNVGGSVPFRLNNPGDISDGGPTVSGPYPAEPHSGSQVTVFPDAKTGWNYLYKKISNHVNGKSAVFPATMTILQFAKKYAGDWSNWCNNVCEYLQVDSSSTFSDYVSNNP